MNTESETDDRPPICPACGVTMGIAVEGDGVTFICLECGFEEDGGDGKASDGAW